MALAVLSPLPDDGDVAVVDAPLGDLELGLLVFGGLALELELLEVSSDLVHRFGAVGAGGLACGACQGRGFDGGCVPTRPRLVPFSVLIAICF